MLDVIFCIFYFFVFHILIKNYFKNYLELQIEVIFLSFKFMCLQNKLLDYFKFAIPPYLEHERVHYWGLVVMGMCCVENRYFLSIRSIGDVLGYVVYCSKNVS